LVGKIGFGKPGFGEIGFGTRRTGEVAESTARCDATAARGG
jgi:hypothetical protein